MTMEELTLAHIKARTEEVGDCAELPWDDCEHTEELAARAMRGMLSMDSAIAH